MAMDASRDKPAPTTMREMTALFRSRADFERAVTALRQAGFDHADISVLASHEALEAAEPGEPVDSAWTALVGELRYAFPLTTAGLIAVFAGAATAPLAAAVTAGIGALALGDYLRNLTAAPHTDEFTRALEGGGALLWVRLPDKDPAVEQATRATLEANGGRSVHVVERADVYPFSRVS